MTTTTTSLVCPVCHEGELRVRIHYEPRTFHYPGHKEIEIIEASCECDFESFQEELWDEATQP